MSVTASNFVQGPATIYHAAFGAVEPAASAVATAPDDTVWTDVGATEGGVKFTVDQKYATLECDQTEMPPESRLVSRDVTIETKLSEVTFANLKLLMNGGTVTTGSGYESLTFDASSSASQPDYSALIIDGWGPSGLRERYIIRKALQTDAVVTEYKKDGNATYAMKMRAHYVSASIAPFRQDLETEIGS